MSLDYRNQTQDCKYPVTSLTVGFVCRYSIKSNHLLKIPVDYSELINKASMFT